MSKTHAYYAHRERYLWEGLVSDTPLFLEKKPCFVSSFCYWNILALPHHFQGSLKTPLPFLMKF